MGRDMKIFPKKMHRRPTSIQNEKAKIYDTER